MRPFRAKQSPPVAVGIDVGDSVLLQLRGMRLGPLRRSQQARLLAVPEAIDHGALRLPSLFKQFRQRACFLQFRARAGYRVACSIDPGVVMIAANYPFVWIPGAWYTCNYVIERLAIPAELQMQVR